MIRDLSSLFIWNKRGERESRGEKRKEKKREKNIEGEKGKEKKRREDREVKIMEKSKDDFKNITTIIIHHDNTHTHTHTHKQPQRQKFF